MARRRRSASEEHANAPVQIDGIAALAIRTDVGIDLLCDGGRHASACARRCWRAARRPSPSRRPSACASNAVVRATAWTSTTATIPQEAGLNERAVSFTKGCYVGQETVARLYYKGKPNRHLRGLRLSQPLSSLLQSLLASDAP